MIQLRQNELFKGPIALSVMKYLIVRYRYQLLTTNEQYYLIEFHMKRFWKLHWVSLVGN